MSEEQGNELSPVGVVVQASAFFEGAEITAVRATDGFIYANLAHLCRALGLDDASQQSSIREHAVLSEGFRLFPLVIGSRVVDRWCLRTKLIALWLTMVPVKRLKEDKQARIYLYQQRAADVLDRLFVGLDAGDTAASSDVALTNDAYAEGLAIARLALEQAQLAQQTAATVEGHVGNVMERLLAIEARLMPREQISEEQAEQISDLVKQAALALATKAGGGNFFGTVYGQLYRMFGVTSYKLITMGQYPKAIAWLEKQIRDNTK